MRKISINKKYKPLFQLLGARDFVGSQKYKKLTPEKQEYWKALTEVDTVLMYGSRNSGKTYAESIAVPLAAKDYNHRVLYTRYAMNSTDQSISQALNSRIVELGCTEDFHYAKNVYTSKGNQGRIFITGHKTSSGNQSAKLKSLEDFSMFITDEAEELPSYDDWHKVKKSIRATDVQCISMLVFNPPTKEHWIHETFFEELGVAEGFNGIVGNVLYIHTTYKDNLEFIPDHDLRDFKKLEEAYEEYMGVEADKRDQLPIRTIKDAKKYKNVGLGMFADVAEGVIYEDWRIGEFNDNLPYIYGMDFGFNDPDACVKVAVDHGQRIIYVDEIYYKNNTGTDQLAEILLEKVGRHALIKGDNAHKRLIADLWHRGLNIEPCTKGKVGRRIKMVQGFTIIATPRSVNTHKSLNNYVWKDSRAGVPDHTWSHIPHALEYACNELIEY